MLINQINKITENSVPFLLAALFFALPISSSGKSIFLSLALFAIILSPIYRQKLRHLFTEWWFKAMMLLIILIIVACFWSVATLREQLFALQKYAKLLCLPILVVAFKDYQVRRLCLHAFLLGMLLIAIITSLHSLVNLSIFINIPPDQLFRNHIMIGIMMSFATYIALLLFLQQQNPPPPTKFYASLSACVTSVMLYVSALSFRALAHLVANMRLLYLAMALLFSYQVLWINTGRTGYFAYIILMILLLFQRLFLKRAIICTVVFITIFTGLYFINRPMHEGIQHAFIEWRYYQQDKNTNIGFRLQFHNYAKQLFSKHPLLGCGTAGFTASFRQDRPVPGWPRELLLEPHSQYWLIATEYGILGLSCFIFFIGSLITACWRLGFSRPIAIALLLVFSIGNLSDSLLYYSGSGYFFIIFMAFCLSESQKQLPIFSTKNKQKYGLIEMPNEFNCSRN